MTRESSIDAFDASRYQRPNDDWVCGHHCEGKACPIGPGSGGTCNVSQICSPVLVDDVWYCTRAKAWGGRCKEGPLPDPSCPQQSATCPHQPTACQPKRSIRNKRRLLTGMTIVASLGVCLAILGGSSGSNGSSLLDTTAVMSPGELTSHHASLEQGCSACHSAADQSPGQLLSCLVNHSGGQLTDSRKCLECHQEFGPNALHAHSVEPKTLNQISANMKSREHTARQMLTRLLGTHQTSASGELACSACHVEHQGVAFNLAELTNQQCQSCHSSSFHSFADGHPEFPERKRAFLYFDHATHLQTHFAKSSAADAGVQHMNCSDCHVQDASGTKMLLAGYEKMCQECHKHQVADDAMPVALRMPGTEFVNINELADQPPFMQILQATSPNDQTERQLIQNLIDGRQVEVVRRLKEVVPADRFDPKTASAAAKRLEESGFFVALKSLAKNSTLTDEAAKLRNSTEVSGSWSVQDGTSLRYRSRGHADPLLRDWLSFAAGVAKQYPQTPREDSSGAFDRLLQQLAAPEASGRCMKCHTMDEMPTGVARINWDSRHADSQDDGFTRFSHGPHITLLSSPNEGHAMGRRSDNRCETCHAVCDEEVSIRKVEFVLDDWMPNPNYHHVGSSGLTGVRRAACATCHTPKLAGDSCLQCHNYHIHPGQVNER